MNAPDNRALREAIVALKDAPDGADEAEFLALAEALVGGDLLVAVRDAPPGITTLEAALERDVALEMLEIQKDDGSRTLPMFTSAAEVAKRRAGSSWLSGRGAEWLLAALEAGFDAIVLDPAGEWLELPSELIRSILANFGLLDDED